MSDAPFIECQEVFAAHESERSANLGINLLLKRRYHWLYQVILISLQRTGRNDAIEPFGRVAIDAFIEYQWETTLLELTLGLLDPETIESIPSGAKATCQLDFYKASILLTKGYLHAAKPLFLSAALTNAPCAEAGLAAAEIAKPEPLALTLNRVLLRCQNHLDNPEIKPFIESAQLAVEIVEESVSTQSKNKEIDRLADGLGCWLDKFMANKEARDLFARLAALGITDGKRVGIRRFPIMQPPLSSIGEYVRQIKFNSLGILERTALNYGFPLFLGRPPQMQSELNLNSEILMELNDDSEPMKTVSPWCRRRFSGDTSHEFPRSRYYSLCPADPKDYDFTLIAELNAYSFNMITGYCAARQGKEPEAIEVVFRGFPNEPNPLTIAASDPEKFDPLFTDLPNNPDPLRRALQDPLFKEKLIDSTEYVVQIEAETKYLDIQKCLDLRRLDARLWLIQFLSEPPHGLHGDAIRALSAGHHIDNWRIKTWKDAMPVINARTVGGNPLTDMIGTYLKYVGCEALIYPSARNDFLAYNYKGELKKWFGWNLVDYRDAEVVDTISIDLGDNIKPLGGQNELREIDEGIEKGSIQFAGNRLFNRANNQFQNEYYISFHGSEWRLKHKKRDLFMRGHFWYRKRYSLEKRDSFLSICDKCDQEFLDSKVQTLWSCPVCNYEGDTWNY